MKTTIIACLVMVLCLIAAGCSKPESRLVGKWVGKTGSFDFMKDKTGIINPPEGDCPSQKCTIQMECSGE